MNHRRQKGFTLVELIMGVFVLGILSVMLSPTMRTFMAASDQAYRNQQAAINQKIANAIIQYSTQAVIPAGTTTAPCNSSGNKIFYAIYNATLCASTAALQPYLIQQGVPMNAVNTDGTANANLRVYQRLSGLSQTTYLFYQAGPVVYLNYDFGVIYLTNCGQSQPCNTTAASSTLPPSSQPVLSTETLATVGAPRLTTANQSTWTPGTRDIGAAYVSTLPLQMQMLQNTANQLDRLRTNFTNYFNQMQAANPGSTANFYPAPSNVARVIPSGSPATNQGCREGWYALDDPTIDILWQIGLGASTSVEYGRTAWGGSISYCRDYDPTGLSSYNAPPHFAALRINRALSFGMASDTVTFANNAVISF